MDFMDGKVTRDDDESQRGEEQKMSKNLQAYKDTMMLIKLKMNKTDTLIRQYNDKIKECDVLNEELSAARSEKQDALNKYNLTLEKVTRLELATEDYKESVKKYQDLSNKQVLKLNENEQHIKQLLHKIKDMEEKNLTLEADLKILQQEIKSNKIVMSRSEKKSNVQSKHQATETNIELVDISINTDPVNFIEKRLEVKDQNVMTDPMKHIFKKPDAKDQAIMTEKPKMRHQMVMTESKKCEMKNQGIVTDECIHSKNEPFPIYCSKCKVLVKPAPIDQILKIMSLHPPLLSENLSPPHSPNLSRQNMEDCRTEDSMSFLQKDSEDIIPSTLNNREYENSAHIVNEVPSSSFMGFDKLSRRISKLEKLLKRTKTEKPQNNCCHNNCCSSKNIKFVVQLPGQEKLSEYRKHEKRKPKRLKRLNNKSMKIKNTDNLKNPNWKVENYSKPKKRKLIHEAKKNPEIKRKCTSRKIDLFEYPEVLDSNVRSNDDVSVSPSISEISQSPTKSMDMESLSLSDFKREANMIIPEKIVNEVAINMKESVLKSVITSDNLISSQSTEKFEKSMHLFEDIPCNNTTNQISTEIDIATCIQLSSNKTINTIESESIANNFAEDMLTEYTNDITNTLCNIKSDSNLSSKIEHKIEKSDKQNSISNNKSKDSNYKHVTSPKIKKKLEEYKIHTSKSNEIEDSISNFNVFNEKFDSDENSCQGESDKQNVETENINKIVSFLDDNSNNSLGESVRENHYHDLEEKNKEKNIISCKEPTEDLKNIASSDDTKNSKTCGILTSDTDERETIDLRSVSNDKVNIDENSCQEKNNKQNVEAENINTIISLPDHNPEDNLCESVCENIDQDLNEKYKEESSEDIKSSKESEILTLGTTDERENIDLQSDLTNDKVLIDKNSCQGKSDNQNVEIKNMNAITSFPDDNLKNSLCESVCDNRYQNLNEEDKEESLIPCKESAENIENIAFSEDAKNSEAYRIPTSDTDERETIDLQFVSNNKVNIDENSCQEKNNKHNVATQNINTIIIYPDHNSEDSLCESICENHDQDVNEKDKEESSIPGKESAENIENIAFSEDTKNSEPDRILTSDTDNNKIISEVEQSSMDEDIGKYLQQENQQNNLYYAKETLKKRFELSEDIQSITKEQTSTENIDNIENNSLNLSNKEIDESLFIKQSNSNVINKEIENVSDESSESQFFLLPRKKSKNSNCILSNESSDEKNVEEENITKRKKICKPVKKSTATGNKKKLFSIIKKIKNINVKPMILIKSEPCSSQVVEKSLNVSKEPVSLSTQLSSSLNASVDSTSFCLPARKQRIAHTPKSTSTTRSAEIINDEENTVTKVIKKTTLTSKRRVKDSDDKITPILEKYEKTCKERAEIARNLNKSAKPLDPISFRALIENDKHVTLSKECILDNEKCTNILTQETNLDESEANSSLSSDIDPQDKNKFSFKEQEDKTAQNSNVGKITKRKRKTANTDPETSLVEGRALRSRQVIINEEIKRTKKLKLNCQELPELINETNSSLQNTTIVSSLNKYLSKPENSFNYLRNRVNVTAARNNECLIYEQLELLMNDEQWTVEINTQVTENLINTQNLQIIALFMIEYTANKIEDEELDKTHTPPAPMMTRSEQKIVTLVLSINKKYPEFSDIIIAGIEHKLFKLGAPQKVQIVERLFRILVVLSKIKKDREKVRMFCCDALYCLNLRAINIIYLALTCWSEVFPKHGSNNDIIVKTIVHIVMTLAVNNPYPKLNSLRKLLSTYYEYPNSGYMTNSFKEELLRNLQENTPGINTAILLLCKKMGPEWSSENIIIVLKQMIVTRMHPSLYDALNLLGNILRSFPANDPNNSVCEIIDQLCDVLEDAEGYNLQEGIVCCLLSISKFKFEQIALSVIKWQSNNDLRPATKDKLLSFFRVHDTKWWLKFIKQNFPLPKQDKV